ncbi:MAG: hypothetical protein RQ714_02280 [Nitrosomonas sp.]|nr:hypothetical protein [Nitrosomonas sp.]
MNNEKRLMTSNSVFQLADYAAMHRRTVMHPFVRFSPGWQGLPVTFELE